MKNMEVKEISDSSENKVSDVKFMDGEDKSECFSKNISKITTEISGEFAITDLAEQDLCTKVSDFINAESTTEEIRKSPVNEILLSDDISKLVSDTCDTVQIIVSQDSSTVEIFKPSVNEIAVSEEISKLVSDTCDTVQIIASQDSPTVEIFKPSVNEIAVSEEISKLVSDTCDTVQIIVNNKDLNGLDTDDDQASKAATTDSERIPRIFEITNSDLFDAEMEDDEYDTNNVSTPIDNDQLPNEEIKNSIELTECDSGDKTSEMNEEEEECTNPFLERDVRDSVRKERHWTERASLPYYREPKPDFFEYTRKLQDELDPKTSVPSSPGIIMLDEHFEPNIEEPGLLKSSTTSGTYRNKTSTGLDVSLKKSNRKPSDKPVSGLIILDDYKSPKVKSSHFSRSTDIWNASNLQSTKEKPEPVPGSKYKALKEQLMEKIMLKKEASFNKRKEEQEVDEENFGEEEEVVSDASYESENDLSNDELEDDSPENAEDDIILKDMLLKECETFSDNISVEPEDIRDFKNRETENFNPSAVISDDSQEPMECYSLPSYQPGGGFSSSPLQNKSIKRIFSNDSDFNDSTLNSPSQQRSSGRIFSDSDFIDSAPMESSEPSQSKKSPGVEFKDKADEQLLFESSNEIIPHWESLPVSEKQGSQLFDEDLSVICSGKFPSTNEDIPWTPSSNVKNSLPINESAASPSYINLVNNETDQLIESDDEELIRPAKKIKLSLVEKLWDSEDEDDADSRDPIVHNGKLKKNHHSIKSDLDDDDDDADQEPDAGSEEEDELDDQSEISQMHVDDSFAESHIKEDDEAKHVKKLEIKNFFENEAELSGEEGSSDENEDDADDYIDDEMITDEFVASDEKLRKEVGTIHFKRQQDEDDQIIRQLKNDFLPEGELYNENGQRKRRFIWSNMGMDENEHTEDKSESEEEEVESLPTDYLKWQQEKNKDLPDDEVEIVQTPKSIGLKVDIVGKVSVTRCSSSSNSSISASPMLRRGSFLNSSIGKNMKFMKEFSSSEGSVSRKNFVFSTPQPNTSLPSTPASQVKSTKINNSFSNRSIFNKI